MHLRVKVTGFGYLDHCIETFYDDELYEQYASLKFHEEPPGVEDKEHTAETPGMSHVYIPNAWIHEMKHRFARGRLHAF